MVALLPNAEQQFCDENGKPYVGGTLDFYIPNTLTRKPTYQDAGGTIANSNPVVLDAAGRAIIYGSGSYRTILKDYTGVLVWDQLSESYLSDTAISAAMAPVVSAETLALARSRMGIDAAIAAAVAAVQLLPGPTGPTGPASVVPGPTGPAGAAGPAGANSVATIYEVWTYAQAYTYVTIYSPTGGPVRWSFQGSPGLAFGDSTYPATGIVTRDGNPIGILGFYIPGEPGTVFSPMLDRPGVGYHNYEVTFYVDGRIAAASTSSNWAGDYSLSASCYLQVEVFG